MQTVLPLDNGDSVKLTTARYYTPSGKSIQASGIVPDVVVKPEQGGKPAAAVLGQDGQLYITEATLPGHLRGDEEGAAGYTPGDVLDGEAPIQAALAELKKVAATAKADSAGGTSRR